MSITRPLAENDQNAPLSESFEGYVVDIACVRKYPRNELLERVREHTHKCLVTGHCVESGYALVADDDRLLLLDPGATPLVLEVTRGLSGKKGIRLRAFRKMKDGEMKTTRVLCVAAGGGARKRKGSYAEERVPPYAA
jgi:hypothetical protein